MTYQNLQDVLGKRDTKKMGNNTYAERRGEDVAIRLHDTDILTYKPDRTCVVSSGGWKTHTTKDRLNDYLRPLQIYQGGAMWTWSTGEPFGDGDVIDGDGLVHPVKSKSDAEKELRLRKSVTKYAKLYEENMPLPMPSNGDCWYCLMRTEDGAEVGGTGHLLSHIEEGYVVPILAVRAMKESGWGDVLIASAFGKGLGVDVCKGRLARAVRKYMCKRLGLVA